MRRVGSALWAWYSNRFVASGGIFMRGLGTWFRSRGVWLVCAVLHRSRGYGEIPSQTASLDRAAGAFLRTLLSALLVVLPTGAWAASTGCDEINNLGGIFTVDSNGVGTDKFTSPGLHALADGERVTYSWSGNTKGAYIYIAWTQNNGSTYAPSSVLDSTATSGSGSFIFSGTSPSDYFQVGIADTNYITEPSIPKPSSRNSTVAISLSCSSTPVLGVAMSHAGNAAQGGLMSYTIFPSVTNSPTTNAPLTASLNLPLGMNISSLSGTGWTCTPSGQTGSCTRTGSFGPGTGPTLNLVAAFAANATTPLMPSVTLSGGGASASASASDATVVLQAPTVNSISPTAGPVGGGTSVTITGTNLSNPTGVTFGGIPSGSFVGGSATQITAVAPAGSGTVDVRVTTVAGTSATSAADQYTYVAAPVAANLDAGTVAFGAATPITLSGSITGSHISIAVPSGPTHGTVVITGNVVSYTPNAGYAGPDSFVYTATGVGGTSAPATVSLTVAQGTQTIAFGTLPNTSLLASPLTLTATASSGLAVSFTSQTTPVCTVSGTTLTLHQPGTCTVQADQAGNGSYSAAPSVVQSFTVTPSPLIVASSGATGLIVGSTFSQTNAASGGIAPYAYVLNAGALPPGTSLNAATGIVSGTPTVAGSFSYQISVTDSQPVTALGPIVTITMAKGNQSIAFTSSAPSSAAVGGSYTVAATATSGLAVSYSLNATSTGCALAGTTVTFVGPGTCRIDADQAGDANWNAAAQAQQTFTVAPAGAVSVALSYAPSTATVGTSGQLTITFTNPNAIATPGFITSLHSNSNVFTRLPGVGGSCGVSAGNTSAPSGAQLDFVNIQIPSGTCTVTVPYQASGAGLASFNVDGFAPAGYPSSPGAVSAAIAVTPSVTAISPGSGPPSQVVTLTGTGFSTTPGNNTVQFGSAAGTVTAASATSLTVTAPATGSGNVTVTVSVNGQTSPAGASFTFIDRPIAADKPGVAVTYNTGTAIDLSTSISGGPHSGITIASAASHGTLSIAGDVVTYTPATGYFGPDSFTYTATGPGGTSAPATVSLTVATPSAPVAADKSGIDVPYGSSGTAIDLTSAITGTYTSMAIATGPAHGTVSTSGTVVTYTPAAGYFGADSFTYTATGPGGTSAPGTVSLTVAMPGTPTVSDRTGIAIAYGSSGTAIDLSGAVSGVHSALAIATPPVHGTASVSGDTITYVPAAAYFGTDSFAYTATGPGGTSAPGTVTVVVATPAAPTAANRSGIAVSYDSSGQAIDLAGAITGVHSGIAIATAPAHGTASITGDVVTYTPTAGYFGADSFTYTATGPGGTSAPATVTMTIATPAAPTAANRNGVVVPYDSVGLAIDLSASVVGVHTALAIATPPAHGTASVSGDMITYVPAAGYFGPDNFTYTASGPGGTSAPASVSLTVATPGAPTVADRTGVAVPYGSSGQTIDLSGAVSGVHTALAIATPPAHGTASFSGDTITYVPAAGYFGADSFTYTATGPGGTSAPASVILNVAVPSPPVAANRDGVAVAYGSSGQAIDLSASVSGAHTALAVASPPAHGTASASGDTITYVPAAAYFGTDSFTYTASGPGGTSAPATVGLVVATPPAPTVQDRSDIAVPYDSPGTAIDLSPSVSGISTGLAVAAAPAHGSVTIAGNTATYVPNTGYFGADSFTYTATGPGGTSAPGTVSLTIATPAAPTVKPGTGSVVSSTQAQKSLDIDLSTLVAGEFTAIELVGASSHGMVALRGTPNVIATYTPNPGFSGTDAFDFVAVGPGGRSAPATVTITVTGTVPTAAAKTAKAVDNQPVSIELTEGATEGPFIGAAIVSIAPADKATAKIVEEGPEGARTYRLEVTPAPHYGGTILITYTLSNQFGTSAPATVTITVTARPDPSLDPNIRALSDAQVESTRRFAQTQSRNFLQRTEQLHNGGGSGKARMGVSLGILDMRRSVSGAFGMATPTDELELVDRMRGRPGNYATAFDPRSAMNARTANAGAGSPEGSEQGEAPSGSSAERPVGSVAVWTGGQLALGTRNRTDDRDKISIATSGLSAGADIKLSPDVTVGLGGGMGFDDSEIGDNVARLHGRSSVAAAYGSTAPFPGMFVDFVIGYGDLRFKTRRIVDGALTRGSRDGSMWFGAASTGIDRLSGNLRWSLYGRGEWLSGTLDAYRENGAGIMDLRFDKRDANSLAGVLGGRFELDKRLLIGSFRPRVRLEWSHEFQDSSAQFLDYADIPGQAFYGIRTEGWTRDQYEVALGGGLYTLSTWVFDMEVGLRGASNQRDGRLTVKVSKDF